MSMTIDKIMEVGLAGLTSNKKLPLVRGEKLFVNRTYCVRDVIPTLLMGKSFVYSEIESAEATVETDGYVVAITPSNFVDIQRSLRKAGFDTVIERAEPIGFHPVGATLMTETVTYYAKYCNKGEKLRFTDKWVVLIGEADESGYYLHNWVTTPAKLVTGEGLKDFLPEDRLWQGIPSLERTNKGRLFASYGSGNECEPRLDNYVAYAVNDGDGWKEFCVAVHPCKHDSRVFDASLWIDPLGRLWLFWSQSCEREDGYMGVWFVRIDDPDLPLDKIESELNRAVPKRIANGIKLNKPTVLSDGTWTFATVNTACDELNYIYASLDEGESWTVRATPEVNGCQHADEPMILELEKGHLKTFVRSTDGTGIRVIESTDNGYTWSKSVDSGLDGPCSRFHIVKMKSGRVLLINHYGFTGRSHLTAMLSDDDGQTFPHKLLLDERKDVSYPDAVERDGKIFVTWDHERGGAGEILLASFTEEEIIAGGQLDKSKITLISKKPNNN